MQRRSRPGAPGAQLTSLAVRTSLAVLTLLAPLAAWPAASGSSGCGAAPPESGSHTLVHGGISRTYGLRLPAGYDPQRPSRLVLAFHGWGGDEGEFLNDATVVAESSRRGYVLVALRGLGSGAPDEKNNSWTFRGSASGVIADAGATSAAGANGASGAGLPICDAALTPDYRYPSCHATARNSCSWTQCQDDDVQFVTALLERLEATLCIDKEHVFASGGSNGGMFTWELGQNPATAGKFRAIAPVIGLPHRGDLRAPGRRGGMPVLLITGTRDTTVPPGRWEDPTYTTTSGSDRYYYTGATAIVRRWAAAEGCATTGPERPFSTGYVEADCRSYCAARAPAWPPVLDCRAPMGHDYDFAWSWRLVLDFFDRW